MDNAAAVAPARGCALGARDPSSASHNIKDRVASPCHGPFAERALWKIDSGSASLRLDVEGPDDVAPLLGFVGDEFAKVSGREREHVATQVGKPRLDLGIGEASVDLLVELIDDLGRRGLRCAEAVPNTPLVAREPTSSLNGVVVDRRYSFFLFDQIVIAVTDSLSVPP
jgi:hypothetical protein